MIKLDLYYANVVDNNDEDKLGKLQIKILPEFKDIKDALLPWARPFMSSGFSAVNNSMALPEIGSNVWVLADKNFRYFRYLFGVPVDGLFDYEAIETSLGDVAEMSDTEYPNVDFDLSNDGSIRFHNRVSGDHGFLHNTGTYFIIDTDGFITVSEISGNIVKMNDEGISVIDKDVNKITLDADGMILEDKNGNKITGSSSGMKLEDSNGNVVDMGSSSVKINGNLEVLQ